MINEKVLKERYILITHVLLSMRLKARYKGFFYLREILILMLDGQGIENDSEVCGIKEIIPKALYIDVSKKLLVSIENIEKSIRVAINRMWEDVEPGLEIDVFGKKFVFPKKKPTNTQFLCSSYNLLRELLEFPQN
mgnify:CR=1 FL=1